MRKVKHVRVGGTLCAVSYCPHDVFEQINSTRVCGGDMREGDGVLVYLRTCDVRRRLNMDSSLGWKIVLPT